MDPLHEKLLADCTVETFRSSGPGGQHANSTDSAVRLTHIPTGIVVFSQQERSQHRNKAICLQKLAEKLEQLNQKAPKRIPLKTPKKIIRIRKENKIKNSQKKQSRKNINFSDSD